MKSVKASYFKTHFGAVLDEASHRVLRIQRRGREATVLLSEQEYTQLKRRSSTSAQEEAEALQRLAVLAEATPVEFGAALQDVRTTAILSKHGRHLND